MIVVVVWVAACVVVMQAVMLVSFIIWSAGLVTAVAYGLMSRGIIAVCAAILTAIGYLVTH